MLLISRNWNFRKTFNTLNRENNPVEIFVSHEVYFTLELSRQTL